MPQTAHYFRVNDGRVGFFSHPDKDTHSFWPQFCDSQCTNENKFQRNRDATEIYARRKDQQGI